MKTKYRSKFLEALKSGYSWPEDSEELDKIWRESSPLHQYYVAETERLKKEGKLEEHQSEAALAKAIEKLNRLAQAQQRQEMPERVEELSLLAQADQTQGELGRVLEKWGNTLASWARSLAAAPGQLQAGIDNAAKLVREGMTTPLPAFRGGHGSFDPAPRPVIEAAPASKGAGAETSLQIPHPQTFHEKHWDDLGLTHFVVSGIGEIRYLTFVPAPELESLLVNRKFVIRIGTVETAARFRRSSEGRVEALFPVLRDQWEAVTVFPGPWEIREAEATPGEGRK